MKAQQLAQLQGFQEEIGLNRSEQSAIIFYN